MEPLRHKPSAYFPLAGNLTDYSGYGNTATRTGTEGKGVGLISNAASSQIVDATRSISYTSPVYIAGQESNHFTLIATVFPVKNASTEPPSFYRENLVKNPSFETAVTPWAGNTNATRTIGTAQAWTGTNSLVLSVTTAGSVATYSPTGVGGMPVIGGKNYVAKAMIRGTASKPSVIQIYWYNSVGGTINFVSGPSINTSTTQWSEINISAVAPSDAAFAAIQTITTGTAGETYYMDAFSFEQTSDTTLPYFDGTSEWYEWTGPAHNSTSRRASQAVLSNQNKYDGITISGREVSFSTKYVNSGEAKCTYDSQFNQRLDVVAVHTSIRNSLYVNGRLVSEVDINEQQQADLYDAPSNLLYSGGSTQPILINGVGMYARALSSTEIGAIYLGNNRRANGSPVVMYGGQELPVSTDIRPKFLNASWSTEDEWKTGVLRNVSVEGGALVPNRIDNLTVSGTWEKSIPLQSGDSATPINSVNMMWTGQNVKVESSIDDTTWVVVNRGVNLSNIPTGFNPANKTLAIRITFLEGFDEGFIDDFQVSGYTNNTYIPAAGRTLTFTNPVVNFPDRPPLDLREDWGVKLMGGSLSWSADIVEEPFNIRTLEVWLKKDSTTGLTLSFTPTATYTNGVLGGAPAQGEWCLCHFVLPADATTLTMSGTVTIGKVGIYKTVLSAGTIKDIYDNYVGIKTTRLEETNTLTLSEPALSVVSYAYDWAVQTA